MFDGANASVGALLEQDDMVVILCPWRHAGFLWSQLLTKRRLYYDREYGDLAKLRDALVRGRAQDHVQVGAQDGMCGRDDADEAVDWSDRPPLTLRLPRGVAVIVARYLTVAQALPTGTDGYDPESASLYPASQVNLAHEVGADWTRQLYLEPNPA